MLDANVNVNIEAPNIPETITATAKILPKTRESIDSALSNTLDLLGYPAAYANAYAQASLRKTKEKLQQKLSKISPEKIVPPPLFVSVPTLQACCYAADSKELHNMFSSLLATAMNTDTQDKAHPSFIEVIKQLSPLEASILASKQFLHHNNFPMCTLYAALKANLIENHPWGGTFAQTPSGYPLIDNIILYQSPLLKEPTDPKLLSRITENFARLRILSLAHDRYILTENPYENLHSLLLHAIDELNKNQAFSTKYKPVIIPSVATLTLFGKSFIESCVS